MYFKLFGVRDKLWLSYTLKALKLLEKRLKKESQKHYE